MQHGEEKTQEACDRLCPVSKDCQVKEGLELFHAPKGTNKKVEKKRP